MRRNLSNRMYKKGENRVKRCPVCGLVKPLGELVRNRSQPGGRGSYCRPCHNAAGRASRTRKWGATRFYHLKARYGITREEFDQLFERQRGLCAICLSEPAAHVDHDHETRQVRGLLCFNCNGGLGQFKDDPMRLALAIAYLSQPGHESAQGEFPLVEVGQ